LAELARAAGWEADVVHANLEFAALVGRKRYEVLCAHRGTLLSEWLFAGAAFDAPSVSISDVTPRDEFEITSGALGLEPAAAEDWLQRVRRVLVPVYLETLFGGTDWGSYDVVAFTSTFQQNVASFALARLIKERRPDVFILFGGANFDGGMGPAYLEAVPFVDAAAIGEADRSFPALLRCLATGEDPAAVPGIACRVESGRVQLGGETVPFDDLDQLPIPDYSDYFDRAERLGFFEDAQHTAVDLPFESARGCWWGAKHHCIFCGLNAQTMRFRSKAPARVVTEVLELSRRYHSLSLEAVDNIIDVGYLRTVLPELSNAGVDLDIFYETKSNVSPAGLGAMAAAGIRRIQPGIESLSTPLLAAMRKGTTGIRNVNFLKWCQHHGVRPSWNLLWGFPGETREHYEVQVRLMEDIVHLQPPDGEGRLWLERFSPMFTSPAEFGVRDVRPTASYTAVYPPEVDLSRAAYFFDYTMDGALPDEAFHDLKAMLARWRGLWRSPSRPSLRARNGPDFVEIAEARPGRREGTYLLTGTVAAVHRACQERPVAAHVVADALGESLETVDDVVASLCERGLMWAEGDAAVTLAVPVGS
jgi:ribosomal peptide maturation radical SAM protein 1